MAAGRDEVCGEVVSQAVKLLRRGAPVIVRTDTGYGLAYDASRLSNLQDLHERKHRHSGKPVAVAVAEVEHVWRLARRSDLGVGVAKRFMPGAVTLVQPAVAGVPLSLLSADGDIGVRVPQDDLCRAICRRLAAAIAQQPRQHVPALAGAITITSANRSGSPPPFSYAQAEVCAAELGVAMIAGNGDCMHRQSSTVIRVGVDNRAELLRSGVIPRSEVAAVVEAHNAEL